MLSAAKHLSDHCDRPFAEFTLSGANGIRVTKHYQYWLLKFIIALVPSLNRGASEARSYRYTMNQSFSAQGLTRKLHLECKQARGTVINLFQNETYLKQIAANSASGAGSRPGFNKSVAF